MVSDFDPVPLDSELALHAVEVVPRIWWVGDVLEGDPFQCHAFLIENGHESVLLDPGSTLTIETTLRKIAEVVDLSDIKWIVLHHSDPDCADALHRLGEVLPRSDVHVITEWRSAMLLRHFAARFPVTTVEDLHWCLELSDDRQLRFLLTPYLHFPGAFVSFETHSATLFSADLFGGFNKAHRLWAVSPDDFEDLRLFHEHYMPSSEILMAGLAAIRGAFPEIRTLLPQHGYLMHQALIPGMFEELSKLECGIMRMSKSDAHLARLLEVAASVRRIRDILEAPLAFVDVLARVTTELASLLPVKQLWIEVALSDGAVLRLDQRTNVAGTVVEGWSVADARLLTLPIPAVGGQGAAAVVIEAADSFELAVETRGFLAMVAGPVRKVIDEALHERASRLVAAGLLDDASHDPLTGLWNRRSLSGAVRRDAPGAVLMLDIDHFKRVNDTYGHAAGDVVLKSVADAILSCLRRVDTAIRYGGEEFLVIVDLESGTATPAAVAAVAERIRRTVAAVDCSAAGLDAPVTISIGATMIYPGQLLADVVPLADQALYEAKAAGRNRCVLDPALRD